MREEDGSGPRRRRLAVLSVVMGVLLLPALVAVSGMRGIWPWWSFLGPVGVVLVHVVLARVLVGSGWHRLLRSGQPQRSTPTWDAVRSFFPVGLSIAIALMAGGLGRGNPPVLVLGGLLAAVPVLVAAGAHRRRERWSPVAARRDDHHDRPDDRGAGAGAGGGRG